MSDSEFDMKPPGKCLVPGKQNESMHRLHGELTDFMISSPPDSSSLCKNRAIDNLNAPSASVAQPAPLTESASHSPLHEAEAVIIHEATAEETARGDEASAPTTAVVVGVDSEQRNSLSGVLHQLEDALSNSLITEAEYADMRTRILERFTSGQLLFG
eukprot:CAMPEP_0185019830 /NCGR_PEP_ID=MMETSP1103-20130426/2414_1 /TAXON_ID=36769 /ORGANISM="Paraphysomonas bandaiensis, Strain Caron Lab Isolate" /LENGTH=157 /DNA_ID=CAMNT_0027550341 /DNA_START=383 /DNA_END=856 /DNA_ORIENTATION=-